jgi:hypothetical protein
MANTWRKPDTKGTCDWRKPADKRGTVNKKHVKLDRETNEGNGLEQSTVKRRTKVHEKRNFPRR